MCAIAEKTIETSHRVRIRQRTPARPTGAAIPRLPITCRAHIAATASGRREDSIATGERIGPATAAFFQAVMADRPHPEQGFRTCLGILSLAKSYGNARVDASLPTRTSDQGTHRRLDPFDPQERP